MLNQWGSDGTFATGTGKETGDAWRTVDLFPKEAPFPPRAWIERGYNVVRWSEMPRGGHFAAWEEPGLLAEDVAAFVSELGLVKVSES